MAEDGANSRPRVLMVDDQKEVADAYALRLEGVADVTVAYGGQEALTVADETTPDVTLLDRHMPTLSGDEVLRQLRDREFRTRVVMVTAIDPDLGVLEMPFDDYLSKPVDKADLQAVVDQQCRVLAYELLGEYFGAASKQAVLRAELPDDTADDELATLEARTDSLRARVERLLPEATDLFDTFAGVDRAGY